jgi:hypothetical protein
MVSGGVDDERAGGPLRMERLLLLPAQPSRACPIAAACLGLAGLRDLHHRSAQLPLNARVVPPLPSRPLSLRQRRPVGRAAPAWPRRRSSSEQKGAGGAATAASLRLALRLTDQRQRERAVALRGGALAALRAVQVRSASSRAARSLRAKKGRRVTGDETAL